MRFTAFIFIKQDYMSKIKNLHQLDKHSFDNQNKNWIKKTKKTLNKIKFMNNLPDDIKYTTLILYLYLEK